MPSQYLSLIYNKTSRQEYSDLRDAHNRTKIFGCWQPWKKACTLLHCGLPKFVRNKSATMVYTYYTTKIKHKGVNWTIVRNIVPGTDENDREFIDG